MHFFFAKKLKICFQIRKIHMQKKAENNISKKDAKKAEMQKKDAKKSREGAYNISYNII